MLSRKTISPVIATALLMVVAVSAVVGFQNFFSSFSSGLFSNVETQNNIEDSLDVQGIIGDSLYLKSGSSESFNMFKIVDNSGTIMCEIQENTFSEFQADTRLLLTFDNDTYNGTHLIDLSGYNNTVFVNGSTYITNNCISGGCFVFDGIDDKMFTYQNVSYPEITISIWVSFTDNDYWGDMPIGNIGFSNDYDGYRITVVPYNHVTVGNRGLPKFSVFKDSTAIGDFVGGIENSITGTVALNKNTWANFIGTEDINGNTCLYRDGVLIECTGGFHIPSNNRANPWIIGGSSYSSFNGTLDEISIYSKALTQSEINVLYNARKAKFYEHILSDGVKEIDVSNCNLVVGAEYNFVGFTNENKVEEKVIAK